jgi:peptidoglycan/LPS O-acetylase OafA/YrhL
MTTEGAVVASRPAQVPALTSLRFFAALMTVEAHSAAIPLGGAILAVVPFQQGVSFFFVLSGFILTYVYKEALQMSAPIRFWWLRFARIYPGHIAAIVFAAIVVQNFPVASITSPAGIANLTMTHSWWGVPGYIGAFNAPSWSISTELGLYLTFPLLVRNLESTWKWKLLAAALLLVAVILYADTVDVPIDVLGARNHLVFFHPLPNLLLFVVGMLACLLWQRTRDAAWVTVSSCTVMEVAGIALICATLFASGTWAPDVREHISHAAGDWFWSVGFTPLGYVLLIYAVAFGRGHVARAISHRLLVLGGEISFALYLTHYSIIMWIIQDTAAREWFFDGGGAKPLPTWQPGLLYLSLCLVVAYVMWRFLECPSRRFLVGLYDRFAARLRRDATPEADAEALVVDKPTV